MKSAKAGIQVNWAGTEGEQGAVPSSNSGRELVTPQSTGSCMSASRFTSGPPLSPKQAPARSVVPAQLWVASSKPGMSSSQSDAEWIWR
jgi:hypothetical protein